MRPSTGFLVSACFAISACATAQELSISSSHGVTFGGPDDGGLADSGSFGGAPGAGGSLPTGSGGLPVGAGGVVNVGGQMPGGGGIAGAQGGLPGAGGGGPPPGSGGGGPVGSGGASAMGGAPSSGGASTGCNGNEKSCGGVCVAPAPANGCGDATCTPCSNAAPAHGFQTCNQGQCDFGCLSGYTKNGTTCGSGTGGGAGGSTSGGGDGGLGVTSCTSTDGSHTNNCPSHCPSNQQTCCQQSNLKNFALCICADSFNQRVLCGL